MIIKFNYLIEKILIVIQKTYERSQIFINRKRDIYDSQRNL